MINKNKDNKVGINDSKMGKNDNLDTGNNKNNKDQEKKYN